MTYTYRMTMRPFSIGCQPKGQIGYKELDKEIDGAYCELTYDRELTEDEVYRFELEYEI